MMDYIYGNDGPEDGEPEDGGSPDGRDARLPLFAQGRPGDVAKPNAWQLMVLWDVSGPDGSCPGATDDEAFGLLGQWGKAESWVLARKLAVVRELVRRRPAAVDDDAEWDDRLAREVSLQLDMSVPGARKLIDFAVALQDRLPGIGAALDDARLKPGPARMITDEMSVLDDLDLLARAEEMVLAGLPKCRTWAELQRLVQRAVCTVDPDGARKRREQAEREHARVRFWREAVGTGAVLATGLPTDEWLAAQAHVEQRAQQYRAAGIKRPIDILRVAAYLDLLNCVPAAERIARFRAEEAGPQGQPASDVPAGGTLGEHAPGRNTAGQNGTGERAGDAGGGSAGCGHDGQSPSSASQPGSAGSAGPWDHVPAEVPCEGCNNDNCICHDWVSGEPPCEWCGHDPCRCGVSPAGRATDGRPHPGGSGDGESGTGGSAPSTGAPGPSPAVASRVNLTLAEMDIPLLTVLGLARRPGEARGLGVLAPDLARQLAAAAARSPGSTFCVTITDQDGLAIGHGCCKPARSARNNKAGRAKAPPGPAPPGPPGAFTVMPRDKPGPRGGYGSWSITLPGRAAAYTVDLHSVPTGHCDHRYESPGHDPTDLLRHLIQVRDGRCGFPTCSRHARESDLEHATPYEEGGKTCACNCWACSRSCHRLKQSRGWSVTETKPGFHQWTTPSGRSYRQEPWRYPA
jgi:hypothetical protein